MAKENDPDLENLNDDEDGGLGGLLGDFSGLMGDDEDGSGAKEIDSDDLALSAILGEDVASDAGDETPPEPETVNEDDDYSSFLKDFGEDTESEAHEPEEESQPPEDKFALSGDDAQDIDLDFSSLVGDEEESPEISVDPEAVTVVPGAHIEKEDELSGRSEDGDILSFVDSLQESDGDGSEEETVRESGENDLQLGDILGGLDDEDEAQEAPLSEEMEAGEEAVPDADTGDEGESSSYGDLVLDMNDGDAAAVDELDSGAVVEESETGADAGYASILGELGDDTKPAKTDEPVVDDVLSLDGNEPEELSFIGLDSDDEASGGQDETAVEATADHAEETGDDSGLLDLDLGLNDSDMESQREEEGPAIAIPSAEEEEEDFLGLKDSGDKEKGKDEFLDVDSGAMADVLFEGVEMDFDEQALAVIRAELLLAQKKNDEAVKLFKEVEEKKGKTFWVEKRLRQLS